MYDLNTINRINQIPTMPASPRVRTEIHASDVRTCWSEGDFWILPLTIKGLAFVSQYSKFVTGHQGMWQIFPGGIATRVSEELRDSGLRIAN